MNEFKHYCYNIKSLCWKAERVRLEGTGEFVGFVSEPAAGADGGASSASAARTPTSSRGLGHRETAPSAVLVHECTKLFWRTSEKLELMIYECSDFDLLLVASYDEDKGVAYPRVAIDIAKARIITCERRGARGVDVGTCGECVYDPRCHRSRRAAALSRREGGARSITAIPAPVPQPARDDPRGHDCRGRRHGVLR